MNIVSLIGNVCSDPDTRYTGEGQTCVTSYRLAVRRDYRKEGQPDADFLNIVCFGKTGEWAEKYIKKGMKIGVTGRIQTGSYENREGQKVYTTDIVASSHTFCQSKAEDSTLKTENASDDFMSVPDDIQEELPFQ